MGVRRCYITYWRPGAEVVPAGAVVTADGAPLRWAPAGAPGKGMVALQLQALAQRLLQPSTGGLTASAASPALGRLRRYMGAALRGRAAAAPFLVSVPLTVSFDCAPPPPLLLILPPPPEKPGLAPAASVTARLPPVISYVERAMDAVRSAFFDLELRLAGWLEHEAMCQIKRGRHGGPATAALVVPRGSLSRRKRIGGGPGA
eukprot:tig00000404_g391.t1